MSPVARPLTERFWEKVDVRGPDECWIWTASRVEGYGRINVGDHRVTTAQRVSWELHYGPIPAGMSACHHCDVPPCVNPRHLFLGTQAENMADMARKGRASRVPRVLGERCQHAKLTLAKVRRIRASSAPASALAQRYGVTTTTILRIRNGETWKWAA